MSFHAEVLNFLISVLKFKLMDLVLICRMSKYFLEADAILVKTYFFLHHKLL